MKKFIVLFAALVLSTGSVFARDFGSTDPLSEVEAASVREALKVELSNTKFVCTSSTGTYGTSAKGLTAIRDFVLSTTVSIFVQGDQVQPVLKFFAGDKTFESIGFVSTSADFKHIASMNVTREDLTVVRTNVGTIVKPIWKDLETRTLKIEVSCVAESAK